MASTDTLPTPVAGGLARFGRRGLLTLAIGVAIALCLSLLPGHRLEASLAYSVCTALACWFFIDGGRLLAARWVHRRAPPAGPRREWPGWGAMALVLPLGTLLGYTLGHRLASALLGEATPSFAEQDPGTLAAILLLSMIPGVAATWFFLSRANLEASRLRAAQAERLAAEQRLDLLASQLEPHMLFNTLANLRALIGIDPARAQAMLDRLIPFLRATLAASRASTHSLADEFARLADYLALMQIRMGTRLQTRLDLPADLAGQSMPALLLQPLVENAIKHGLEPKIAGGRIDVGAAREGSVLVLRVRDTGVGLAAAAGAPRAPGSGFGLAQVRERLATLHGAAARLVLEPAADADGGTLATLRLPLP
ncbi:MAG: histidine kinase [Piscinibacter sp.]|nr:histidine kinase [Piscinibacter sp.]